MTPFAKVASGMGSMRSATPSSWNVFSHRYHRPKLPRPPGRRSVLDNKRPRNQSFASTFLVSLTVGLCLSDGGSHSHLTSSQRGCPTMAAHPFDESSAWRIFAVNEDKNMEYLIAVFLSNPKPWASFSRRYCEMWEMSEYRCGRASTT